MSQITTYSDLYAQMVPDLPSTVESQILLQCLQRAGREFSLQSEAIRDDLYVIPVVDYQKDYALANYLPYSSMQVQRIVRLRVNSEDYEPETYRLWEDDTLRFKHGYEPNNLDDMLLVCGTAGSTAIATWQAITDGSFTFDLSDDEYLVENLNFSSCSSMAEVAAYIETEARQELDEDTIFVEWVTNHFQIYVESGEITYLTAGTSGTDISGASWMNGLSGGTGVSLASHIQIEAVFRCDKATDTLPDWFLDRYADGIKARALYLLFKQPKKPWTDANLAAVYLAEYKDHLNKALIEDDMEGTNGMASFSA